MSPTAPVTDAPPQPSTWLDGHTAALDEADRRAARRDRWVLRLGQLGVGLAILGLWELASGRWVDQFFLSKPSLVAERLVELFGSGEIFGHLRVTLSEFAIGLAIGMLAGIALGLFVATSRVVGGWIYPYIIALYSLPRVALAPLFVVWFGIGLTSKVIMVVTMVIFVAFYNVHQGVRNIDPDLLEMARSYRATRIQVLRKIIVPAITPWTVTALRLSIGLGLIGAVIAEMIGATAGVGYYIRRASGVFDTTGVFTGLFVIMAIAIAFERLVALLESRLLDQR